MLEGLGVNRTQPGISAAHGEMSHKHSRLIELTAVSIVCQDGQCCGGDSEGDPAAEVGVSGALEDGWETKGLRPEESRRRGREQELWVCPPAGTGLLRLEQPAQRGVQEVRAGTGQRLMTKPSHVHAIPSWSL